MIERAYLQAGYESIATDGTGPHLRGPYSALYTLLLVSDPQQRHAWREPLLTGLQRAQEDLRDSLTVLWRVEWQRELVRAGELEDNSWMHFVAADVRGLHVSLRAFYDSVCDMLRPIVAKPGQVRLKSFRELLQWLRKPGRRSRIGEELADEIAPAEAWFWDLRAIRDGVVHEGARPLVFPQVDRIGFMVHRNNLKGLQLDGVMLNQNVIDFELYAACQVGQAIGLLQRLCGVALRRIGNPEAPENLRSYHPGLGVLVSWMGRLLSHDATVGCAEGRNGT